MKVLSGIYAITNSHNGKMYIGSSVNINGRWNQHRFQLRHKKNCSKHLQRAWDKYGEDAFEFSVLELVSDKCELTNREQYWIEYHNSIESGYNIRLLASSQLGMKHTEESKKKMSLSHIGKITSDETKAKMSAWQVGKLVSIETRKKISEKNIGKVRSADVKEKMSQSRIGRKHSDATKLMLSNMFKGKTVSEATREKLSQAAKDKYANFRINCPEKLKQSREHIEKRELARLATLRRKKELVLAEQ